MSIFFVYFQEMVGPFHSEFYVINGMLLESRKRREHLSEEDLQKNKAIMESLTKGNTQGLDTNGEVSFVCVLYRKEGVREDPFLYFKSTGYSCNFLHLFL